LLAGAAEDAAEGGVDVEVNQVAADQGDAVEGLVEDGLELGLALPHGVLGLAGAEEGVDGGDEDGGLDGVGEVAVGAGLEAVDLVDVLHERGGEVDDGDAGGVGAGAEAAADL